MLPATSRPPFSQSVSFGTCSFLKPESTLRRRLLEQALPTWKNLLDLPFSERIFLDDRSPLAAATLLLEKVGLTQKFDQVCTQSKSHPPHSNFGIVGSLELGTSPYLLHLDDDVTVTGSAEEIQAYLERALQVLIQNPEIMGINLLKVDPRHAGFQDWAPGEAYGDSGFHHPRRYFGTCASIIRRELLARADFAQIMAWGTNQPRNWEELVTWDTREFLVGPPGSPFSMSLFSFFFKSTAAISLPGRVWYCLKQGFKARLMRAE